MWKKSLILLSAAALILACGPKKNAQAPAEDYVIEEEEEEINFNEPENPTEVELPGVFDIETSLGDIRIRLYEDTPHHYRNFTKLAKEGFYDGVLFHRVIKDFMIQTGDPFTKDTALVARYGEGGPGYTLPAEILPQHTHIKGAVAAARLSDMANPLRESSGSQFYIVLSEEGCRHLDGAYTVFGETISGMEVVEKIGAVATNLYDRPLEPVCIKKVSPVMVPVETEEEEEKASEEEEEEEAAAAEEKE